MYWSQVLVKAVHNQPLFITGEIQSASRVLQGKWWRCADIPQQNGILDSWSRQWPSDWKLRTSLQRRLVVQQLPWCQPEWQKHWGWTEQFCWNMLAHGFKRLRYPAMQNVEMAIRPMDYWFNMLNMLLYKYKIKSSPVPSNAPSHLSQRVVCWTLTCYASTSHWGALALQLNTGTTLLFSAVLAASLQHITCNA